MITGSTIAGVTRLCTIAILLCALAPSAQATTGGDAGIDWVGWHEETSTLWWRNRSGGECDPCPYAFWSLGAGESAPVRHELTRREQRALRTTATTLRARSLRAVERAALSVEPTVTERDRLRVAPDLPTVPRLRLAVHVTERRDDGSQRRSDAQLIAFRSPRVRIVRTAQIPGRAETLVVLRYTGIPYETGYQDETIAILR